MTGTEHRTSGSNEEDCHCSCYSILFAFCKNFISKTKRKTILC